VRLLIGVNFFYWTTYLNMDILKLLVQNNKLKFIKVKMNVVHLSLNHLFTCTSVYTHIVCWTYIFYYIFTTCVHIFLKYNTHCYVYSFPHVIVNDGVIPYFVINHDLLCKNEQTNDEHDTKYVYIIALLLFSLLDSRQWLWKWS
jgi:hypothetical protein